MPPRLTDWLAPDGAVASSSYFTHVQDEVVQWWLQHRRGDLPWRPPSHELPGKPPFFNPYAIWVSEVMSQQTLMGTVIGYYTTWMTKFPTIEALARASEDEVRAVWSGMGYYRRAMYLLKGAQYLVERHQQGKFTGCVTMPSTVAELLKVPGVGPYTAGAIASVCFGEPVIATDGNVVRVVSRLRGERDFDPKLSANIKVAAIWGQHLMCGGKQDDSRTAPNPGGLNQGLMELGASVCRPNAEPLCAVCPLRNACRARALHAAGVIASIDGVIPLRGSRVTKRKETVVCVVHEVIKENNAQYGRGRFVVVRRPADGLLGGMLEFPSLSVTATQPGEADDCQEDEAQVHAASEETANVMSAVTLLGCGAALPTSTPAPRTARKTITPPPMLRAAGTVTHVFSHIEMSVKVFHVQWLESSTDANGDAHAEGDNGVFGSRFSGVCTDVEDAICTRVAVALHTATAAAANSPTPALAPRKRSVSQRKKAAATPLKQHGSKTAGAGDTIESRIAVLSEEEVRKAAASRLLLKILEATGKRETKPTRSAKRCRSKSPA